jgi:hypothetical protein
MIYNLSKWKGTLKKHESPYYFLCSSFSNLAAFEKVLNFTSVRTLRFCGFRAGRGMNETR